MTTAAHDHSLGERIRTARLAKGWSQTQLAEAVGSSKKSVGLWERTGAISPLSLGRLAATLKLDTQGSWVEEEAPTTRHITRLTMEAPLPQLTASEPPLETVRRVRRELARLAVQLDGALEAMEAEHR